MTIREGELEVRGLNHLTLAVTDLQRSIAFYADVLGFVLRARWDDGAYLETGALWLCLAVDPMAANADRRDYTHYAFDVSPHEFEPLSQRVRAHAPIWKENRSEGPSLYFLDPDGHRLELHVGSLASRLADYARRENSGVTLVAGEIEIRRGDSTSA